MADSAFTLSDLLGYTSIGCWLGAQFPQVIENWRRQSCEGLALPFLANWLLGDISNLVGCILTNQLPFQKWLAVYFVFVDLSLVAQYFYYSYAAVPKTPAHFGHPRLASAPGTGRRISHERGASRYRTLSTVAANVAAAAALAAQQVESRGPPPGSARTLRSLTYGADDTHPTVRSPVQPEDEEDDDAAAALMESFHSEGGRRLGRKRVTYSIERQGSSRLEQSVGHYPPLPTTATMATPTPMHVVPSDILASEPLGTTAVEPEEEGEVRQHTGRRHSRARSRGTASMVFLGAWALVGIGTLANSRRGVLPSSSQSVGRLLVPQDLFNFADGPAAVTDSSSAESLPNIDHISLRVEDAEEIEFQSYPDEERPPQPQPEPQEPDFEHVIGRFFAWLCTTLYLTSRLPQIWKNFVRKSVEGLSMYLFVFAFLGNTFYVASILLSPKTYLPPPASTEFLRESIPYLLGSGGTLMFDMAIVTQSFLYRSKPKRSLTRSRLSISEEEAGLLSGDALHEHHPDSAILNRGRPSRTRSVGPP